MYIINCLCHLVLCMHKTLGAYVVCVMRWYVWVYVEYRCVGLYHMYACVCQLILNGVVCISWVYVICWSMCVGMGCRYVLLCVLVSVECMCTLCVLYLSWLVSCVHKKLRQV